MATSIFPYSPISSLFIENRLNFLSIFVIKRTFSHINIPYTVSNLSFAFKSCSNFLFICYCFFFFQFSVLAFTVCELLGFVFLSKISHHHIISTAIFFFVFTSHASIGRIKMPFRVLESHQIINNRTINNNLSTLYRIFQKLIATRTSRFDDNSSR